MADDTDDTTARTLADRYRSDGSGSRALQTTAGDLAASARDATGTLGGRIQEQPLVAILIAAAVGYIVGRIGRHV